VGDWAFKIQTPGNYPKESIQHSENGKSLKSRIIGFYNRDEKCLLRGTNWVFK
jgi:hypothetical protein